MSTIGVDYGVKPVNVRGRDVRVNFFDLGGLDAYTDIRTEFYQDASGALVVFALDGRTGFERLDAWLAESRAAGAPRSPARPSRSFTKTWSSARRWPSAARPSSATATACSRTATPAASPPWESAPRSG